MRINGFEQIKGFYSWVFENQDKNVRTTHISLYMFLVNQNNRNRWVEWFKCPFDLAMAGSGITNKNTYYKTLTDLQEWGLIKYKKGVNNYKAPLIYIEVLFDTSAVPQSEPQVQPQTLQLPLPLMQPQMTNNIKLLTSNLEPITKNIYKVIDFIKRLESEGEEGSNDKKIIEYSEEDFLKNWTACRKHYLKQVTYIKKLDLSEKAYFNKAIKEFTKDQINTALHGLFKQENKNISSMYTKPKHFLSDVSKYLNAEMNKDYSLYGKDQSQSKKGGL